MSSSVDSYANSMYDKFKPYYAAWPPNTPLRLGDIGTFQGKLFQYRSNLETMGVRFGINPPSVPIDQTHSSGYKFELNQSISAQAKAAGIKAQAKLSFDSSGAFVFEAMNCVQHEIADKLRLAEELTRLFREKLWDKDWAVIESLYEVEKATIIVANNQAGHLEVSANADFPVGNLPLVRTQGALTVTFQSADFSQYIARQGLTPMFGLYRVKWIEIIKRAFAPVTNVGDVLEPL